MSSDFSRDFSHNSFGEKRDSLKNKFLFLVAIISLGITTYSKIKEEAPLIKTYKAASKLASQLAQLRNAAILKQTPISVFLIPPQQIEVYEANNCGPNAQKTLLWKSSLEDLQNNISFVTNHWLKAHAKVHEQNEGSEDALETERGRLLNPANQISRYCYDPIYGSSIVADGLSEGVIFLAHQKSLLADREEQIVSLKIVGANGDFALP